MLLRFKTKLNRHFYFKIFKKIKFLNYLKYYLYKVETIF